LGFSSRGRKVGISGGSSFCVIHNENGKRGTVLQKFNKNRLKNRGRKLIPSVTRQNLKLHKRRGKYSFFSDVIKSEQ